MKNCKAVLTIGHRFMLALLLFVMIESPFCIVQSIPFGTGSSQRSLKSQMMLRPIARAQFVLNDTDFLKEFSCYE
jgi:hypothetical protein